MLLAWASLTAVASGQARSVRYPELDFAVWAIDSPMSERLEKLRGVRDQEGLRRHMLDRIDRCPSATKGVCAEFAAIALNLLAELGDRRALPRALSRLRPNRFRLPNITPVTMMSVAAKLDVDRSQNALLRFYEADAHYRYWCAQTLGRYAKNITVAAKLEAHAAKTPDGALRRQLVKAAADIRARATR